MKLDDALNGVRSLAFDTAPLIYFVERNPTYLDVMRTIVQLVDSGRLAGFSSVVTLTEVLTYPKRVGNKEIENEYRSLLIRSRNFVLIGIDPTIAESAADLRVRYRLRTPDALQIAAALEAGCQGFLTNDRSLKRVDEIRVLLLEELDL
jgi:predicted nucleic acid-binding protein